MSGICLVDARKFESQVLPKLPTSSMNIWQKISHGTLEYHELAQIVETDPILAGEVIRITNSSFYGLQRKIGSVLRAVILLGNKTIRSLVRGLILRKVKFNSAHLSTQEQQDIWSHNLTTAILARSLAVQSNLCDPEEAFLTGLLHDIGKLINPTEAEILINLQGKVIPLDLHVEMATLLCAHWNMPENIGQVILWHHQSLSPVDTNVKGLHTILRVANTLAKIAGYASDLNCPVDISSMEDYLKLGGKMEQLRQVLLHLPEAVKSLAAPFGLQVHEKHSFEVNQKYVIGLEISNKGLATLVDLMISKLGYTPANYYGSRNDNLKINIIIHDRPTPEQALNKNQIAEISLIELVQKKIISLDNLTSDHLNLFADMIVQSMMKVVTHV